MDGLQYLVVIYYYLRLQNWGGYVIDHVCLCRVSGITTKVISRFHQNLVL